MSGSYVDAAAETIAADIATAMAGLNPALAQAASGQSSAEAFVADNGAEVIDGHSTVGYMPPIIATGE